MEEQNTMDLNYNSKDRTLPSSSKKRGRKGTKPLLPNIQEPFFRAQSCNISPPANCGSRIKLA